MCQIVYSTKDKSTRPGFHTKPTIIQNYPDKKLCLVDHYVHYKQRTAKLRSSSTQELLITLQKPHNAISRATLSRWIKDVLQAAGIDISIFGAHSTRSASTSAALVGGAAYRDHSQCSSLVVGLNFRGFLQQDGWRVIFSSGVQGCKFVM